MDNRQRIQMILDGQPSWHRTVWHVFVGGWHIDIFAEEERHKAEACAEKLIAEGKQDVTIEKVQRERWENLTPLEDSDD